MTEAIDIAAADGRTLAEGDIVDQAGVPYRVVGFDDWQTVGAGRFLDRVYFVPTHNEDGDPMPAEADIYSAPVHPPTGHVGQIRWWGPQHAYRARLGAGGGR